MSASNNKTDRFAPHLELVNDFFMSFSRSEARAHLHKMMRAAFAQEDILTKQDIKDLIFMKDELYKLIRAAEALAQHKIHRAVLGKFFRHEPAAEWIETLDMLFYAAIYDGFFTSAPNHTDIYHYCRGLHALVSACAAVDEANNSIQEKPG